MATFFVTGQKGKVINIDFINAITPIKLKDLYENSYSLSSLGRVFVDEFDESQLPFFGIKKVYDPDGEHFRYCLNIKTKFYKPDEIIAYAVHLNCSSGGINNSHLIIYISTNDYRRIVDMFF